MIEYTKNESGYTFEFDMNRDERFQGRVNNFLEHLKNHPEERGVGCNTYELVWQDALKHAQATYGAMPTIVIPHFDEVADGPEDSRRGLPIEGEDLAEIIKDYGPQ